MRFFNTEFSKTGFEDFQKLTRKQQIEYLKQRNPLILQSVIERELKGVKYGKSKRSKKTSRKSDTIEASEES